MAGAGRTHVIVLGTRELEVVTGMANGFTCSEIGQRLYLSPRTIEVYASRARDKLGARNGPHLVALALKLGLLVLSDIDA